MATRVMFRALSRLSAVNSKVCRPVLSHSQPLKSQMVSPQSLCHNKYTTSAQSFECVNIQDSTDFQKQVLHNATPVVVDFYATWCGPCKILGPRLESIIGGKQGKVVLAKVDIDKNPELAMKYGVRSVPTVIGMKKGEILDQFVGCREDDEVDSFVEKLIL